MNVECLKLKNRIFKLSNNKEYSLLYYLSKYPDTFLQLKANNFFFSDFLKNYLFNARITKMTKILYECEKEVESLFPEVELKKEVRIFYLKKNIFVADEVG